MTSQGKNTVLVLLLFVFASSSLHAQPFHRISINDCVRKFFHVCDAVQTLENLELIDKNNKQIIETALLPRVSFNGNYNYYIQNSSIAYNDNILPPSTINNARSTVLSGSLTASFDVINFSQSLHQVKAQKFLNAANKENYIIQENKLIIQIANLYSDCYISQLLISHLNNRVELSKKLMDISERNLTLGQTDSIQYLQSFANYQTDLIALNNSKIVYSENCDILKSLLNISLKDSLEFESIEEEIEVVSRFTTDSKFDDNYETSSIKFQIKQQRFNKSSNYFNFIPSVSFFGGYSLSDQRFQNGIFAQNKAFGPTYGLNLSYGIGQFKNAIHQNKINQLLIQNLAYELAQKDRENDIFLKHQKLKVSHLQLEINSKKSIVDIMTKSIEKSKVQFENGMIRITEIRDIQNQQLESNISLLQSFKATLINQLELLSNNTELEKLYNNQ